MAPTPTADGFGDGTYVVGEDLDPGTYRSAGTDICSWARLGGFSDEVEEILADGSFPTILTLGDDDVRFQTQGCGPWYPVEATAPDQPTTRFGDGTFQVGLHIEPGTYTADGRGEGFCYWSRLAGFSGRLSESIDAGNDPATVEISPDDAGFETQHCGTWTRD